MQSHWKQAGKEGKLSVKRAQREWGGVERGEMRRGDYLQKKKKKDSCLKLLTHRKLRTLFLSPSGVCFLTHRPHNKSHSLSPSTPEIKGALTHTLAPREKRGWGMLFLQSCTVVLTLLPSCGFILPKIESKKKIYMYAELNQQIKGLSDVTGWWEVSMLWMNSKALHY